MLVYQRKRALEQAELTEVPSYPDGKGCPLRGQEIGGGCTVYGGRPLICRLFGYSGDRGKESLPRFRPCRFHPEAEKRTIEEAEIKERFSVLPPLMGDFSVRIINLSPETASNRMPLRKALPDALRKIKMLRKFSYADLFGTAAEDNPDPDDGNAPLPEYPNAV